jgi:hypothetical protein
MSDPGEQLHFPDDDYETRFEKVCASLGKNGKTPLAIRTEAEGTGVGEIAVLKRNGATDEMIDYLSGGDKTEKAQDNDVVHLPRVIQPEQNLPPERIAGPYSELGEFTVRRIAIMDALEAESRQEEKDRNKAERRGHRFNPNVLSQQRLGHMKTVHDVFHKIEDTDRTIRETDWDPVDAEVGETEDWEDLKGRFRGPKKTANRAKRRDQLEKQAESFKRIK